jgi:hypothetical protein
MKAVVAVAICVVSINALAGKTPAFDSFSMDDNGKLPVNVTGANGGQDPGKDQLREELTITVIDSSGPVSGAKCILTNDKGDWSVSAPDTVTIRRSASTLKVRCEKDGYTAKEDEIEATTIQLARKHFHFANDVEEDDADALVTVPQYSPLVVVNLNVRGAPQATN